MLRFLLMNLKQSFKPLAGIYIHYPFCKQACHYCNFHFSTGARFTAPYLSALHKEIGLRRSYLKEPVETIYLGGGTPSILPAGDLGQLFNRLYSTFEISADAEVTLEANPDDLLSVKNKYLKSLRQTPVNRLSIGVQSFQDKDLQFMNRVHSGKDAMAALKNGIKAGFNNMTADLIYGTPTLTDAMWLDNLQRLIDLGLPHISAYALTVEKNTALHHFIEKAKVSRLDDHKAAYQFEMMAETLEANEYQHYEISNFAKPGSHSRHNTNYWKGVSYLGLGASAHSYNGVARQWNIANTPKYISGMEAGQLRFETETLSIQDHYNEYIMTSLRTMWGVDAHHIQCVFGTRLADHFKIQISKHHPEAIEKTGEKFILTRRGKLFADRIAADLFAE